MKEFSIEALMTPQQVFETETFYAFHMRKLIEEHGLNFQGLATKIAAYLDKKGYYDAADRQAAADQFTLELFGVGNTTLNLMKFSFGLKVLGYESLVMELRVHMPNNNIPTAMLGRVELGKPWALT